MKKTLILLIIAVLSTSVHAAVSVGENLIINGLFEAEHGGCPDFWEPSSANHVRYLPTGGPEGKKAAVVLLGDGPISDNSGYVMSLRQHKLLLVAGGTYKLSAFIKTRGFVPKGGLIIHNADWDQDVGLTSMPTDSDWMFFENTFTLFPSKNGQYGLAFFAKSQCGEIAIADVKLEAISEEALQGSFLAPTNVPCLIPLTPLLNRIPFTNPKLTFQFYGDLPQPQTAYECLVTVEGSAFPQQKLPLQSGKITANFTGLPLGNYTLEASVQHRETHEKVLRVAHPFSLVAIPEIDYSAIKPLNTLVSELLNQPITATLRDQTLTFDTPRDGWVFMTLVASSPATSDLKVTLDGQDTVIIAATDRLEAFRDIAMGTHSITVSGANPDMHLIVRSIPEIVNYPNGYNSQVKENGLYDWEFMKKHMLYALTTMYDGRLPPDALSEAKTRGLRWLSNFNIAPFDDPADIQERMESTPGMNQPEYDGIAADEVSFDRPTIDIYTQVLKKLRNPKNRLIYTALGGKPSIPSLHTDFLSTCFNTSKGRGRLFFEAYCNSKADEKTANAYLESSIDETMRRYEAFFPNALAGTCIILGNFNQIPILTLDNIPDVDYKYFLDMQVNRIVNNPMYKNLAAVGYWGTYYADEEMARWSFKLMRHYAVEGRKEMLSDHYGFTYIPGFLKNGGFADGLNEWRLTPAAENAIQAETLDGYGMNCQGRYGGGSAGDTVCVMTRQAAAPNRISQTAHGLTVGKVYCLQFVTADRNDVITKNYNPRRYGIDVELDGVKPIADKSFVHIDERKSPLIKEITNVAKINLHRIVFRAESPDQTIVFHDANALPGEALCINFIQLKPYFE